jgi:hypothetical protein
VNGVAIRKKVALDAQHGGELRRRGRKHDRIDDLDD